MKSNSPSASQFLGSVVAVTLALALLAQGCKDDDPKGSNNDGSVGGANTGGRGVGSGGNTGSGGVTGLGGATPMGTGGSRSDVGSPGSGGAGFTQDAAAIDTPFNADSGMDARSSDATRDVAVSPDLVSGGPGCGAGSLCLALYKQYAEALVAAKSCTVGAPNACALTVEGALGCGACEVVVDVRGDLDALTKQFAAAKCEGCFLQRGTVNDHCHPVVCTPIGQRACVAGPSGKGTCVVMERDHACPPGAADKKPCTSDDDYCSDAGKVCACRKTPAPPTWSCL